MSVQLNHHIVHATDARASAEYLAEMLGLPAPKRFGPFWVVTLDNGVSLDFVDAGDGPVQPGHYAFLVSEEEWDEIFERIKAKGHDYYADPHGGEKGRINRHDGGRGVYWADPDGHWLEIITVPYGGWGD